MPALPSSPHSGTLTKSGRQRPPQPRLGPSNIMQPSSLAARLADALADGGWRAKARPEQLAPEGPWFGFVVLAGRGWGKTRTGAEWVREQVESGAAGNIALVAPTAGDARDVMVEGP